MGVRSLEVHVSKLQARVTNLIFVQVRVDIYTCTWISDGDFVPLLVHVICTLYASIIEFHLFHSHCNIDSTCIPPWQWPDHFTEGLIHISASRKISTQKKGISPLGTSPIFLKSHPTPPYPFPSSLAPRTVHSNFYPRLLKQISLGKSLGEWKTSVLFHSICHLTTRC